MRKMRVFLLALGVIVGLTGSLAAADTTIKGLVTDSAGKPVRGATVKATLGTKSVRRFTQNDGRYDIAIAPAFSAAPVSSN